MRTLFTGFKILFNVVFFLCLVLAWMWGITALYLSGPDPHWLKILLACIFGLFLPAAFILTRSFKRGSLSCLAVFAVLLIWWQTLTPTPNFDSYPEGIAIYDNEITGGGDEPDSIIAALQPIVLPDGGNIPGIVWDGAVDEAKLVDGAQSPTDRICIQQPGVEVLNADAANGFAAPRIDPAEAYDCTLDPLAAVELPGA